MRQGISTLALPLLLLVTGLIPTRALAAATTLPAGSPAAVIRLEGKIDDYNRDGFFNRFNQAKAAGAKVVIIDLDTYGGLVTSGLDISRFLKN